MRFPEFVPAKRADVPNYVQAEIYQNAFDRQDQEYKDQKRREMLELPRELYNTYSDVTGTEPIADALERNKIRRLPSDFSQQSGPVVNDPSGTTSGYMNMPNGSTLPPGSPTTPSPGVHGNAIPAAPQPIVPVSANSGAQAINQIPSGGADLAQSVASNANITGKIAPAVGDSMGVAAPVAGAFAAPALTAANGGSVSDVTKSTVGGGASSVLAASWPGLAASGPGGWAAIAALSAASLYGMFA